MAKKTLRLTSRFALVLVVLIPALLVMLATGLHGLQSGQNVADTLYKKNLIATERVSALDISLEKAQQTTLQLLLADTAADQLALTTDLVMRQVPAIEVAFNAIASQADSDHTAQAALAQIAGGWGSFLHALADGSLAGGQTQADKNRTADELDSAFDQATAGAGTLIAIEGAQAEQAHRHSIATFHSSIVMMLTAGALGLISSVGIVVWLLRGVLPRTLAYSAFAAEVSDGDYTRRLRPSGADELDRLGAVLDDLAERRQAEDTYDRQRLELIDSLQLAEGEQEAHLFLKRHVELAVPGCEVTILNRNNSAGRLQAVTPVPQDSALAAGLESAKPRSCLAVRRAQPHSSASAEGLLGCAVCSGCPGHSVCAPLIVGGEVIGSVLANHQHELGEVEQRSIREAVTHAAPVMGNLRNLAIAERRASTDSLTGLPNKRAIGDTLRRMVAHANKTKTPLSALMCDLDHFKQVNDHYGHGAGDDLLAAIGAAFSGGIRVSDFAGRYGGEEFLILLPETDADGALELAEKVRAAVHTIRVPSVDRLMTLSVGIAVLPHHALDSESLLRAADRALYDAKKGGRDRAHVVSSHSDAKAKPSTVVALPAAEAG